MKKDFLSYNHGLVPLARKLRRRGTLGEVIVWRMVRKKRVCEQRFLRQRPIGQYIVDFVCQELRLIIEVDGSTHDAARHEKHIKRQDELETAGYKFLRISERFVRFNTAETAEAIKNAVEKRLAEMRDPTPSPIALARNEAPSLKGGPGSK